MMQMNDAWYLHQDNVTTYIAGYMVYKLEDEACVLLACSSGYLIMQTIQSMRGIYAENSQDGKYAKLDRFVEAYRFHAPRIFAESRYQATTQTLDRARRPAAVPEETDVTKLMNFVKSELRRLTSLPTVTADEYRLRALMVDPLQWQERSANWHMAERMAGRTERRKVTKA